MKDKLSFLVSNILNKNIKIKDKFKTSYITKIFKKNISTDFQEKQTFKTIKKNDFSSKKQQLKTKTKFLKKNTKFMPSKKISQKKISILKKMINNKGSKKVLKELSKKRDKNNNKKIVKEMNWIKLYLLNDN